MVTPPARSRAFTLIELVVLFGVVLVVTTLAVSARWSTHEHVDVAHCFSNIRQLATAARMYAEDYDGRFMDLHRNLNDGGYVSPPVEWQASSVGQPPAWFDAETDPAAPPNWASDLNPYTKNDQICLCPESADAETRWQPDRSTGISYAYNVYVAEGNDGRAAALGQVPRPAATVLLWCTGKASRVAEAAGRQPNCPRAYPDWRPVHGRGERGRRTPAGRMVSFADSHAKWFVDDDLRRATHPTAWDWRLQHKGPIAHDLP
jgi:competence protein ComGC